MSKLLFFVMLLALVIAVPMSAAQDPLPAADELPPAEWSQLFPGGETTCAYGDEYSFFVRPNEDSDKLMIYFQGGGACWDGFNCADTGFKTFASEIDPAGLDASVGLFDFQNPANPAADYNVVHISVCTGDVHTGDNTMQYTDELTIQHKGAVNAQAALAWIYENYPSPSEVDIVGCSAGSLGALFHAPAIYDAYGAANIQHLGDSYVGVAVDGWDGLLNWRADDLVHGNYPSTIDIPATEFVPDDFYVLLAERYPDVDISQFNTLDDGVQALFYSYMGGDSAIVPGEIASRLAEIDAVAPNFDYYSAVGDIHCVTANPAMYDLVVNDVPFIDWFTDFLSGEDVETVATAAE